jgi:hypothetical protein
MLPALSDDVWVQIGLHLKPRHLSKLMRTNKRIMCLVDNEAYWTRVAAHLVGRDHWMLELKPYFETYHKPEFLPPGDSSLYFMVGLDRGYHWAMESFMDRFQCSVDALLRENDPDGRDLVARFHGLQTVQEKVIAMDWFPCQLDKNTMKQVAKHKTIEKWVDFKNRRFGDKWPSIRKFLIDLEDDPMPAMYKRRIMRNICETFGNDLLVSLRGALVQPCICTDLCIF